MPLSSPTPSLDKRVSELENRVNELQHELELPQKDVWDKISSISGLLSGMLIAIIGGVATYVYREREKASEKLRDKEHLSILRVQTIQGFMSQFQSGDEKVIEAALLAITALGDPELTTNLAKLYRGSGTISALTKIADSSLEEAANKARQSLDRISIEGEKRIMQLMRLFNGQQVPGDLFGMDKSKSVSLPAFTGIMTNARDDRGNDIHARSHTDEWLVQVKLSLDSFRHVKIAVNSLQMLHSLHPSDTIWLVVLNNVERLFIWEIAQKGFLVSSHPEIEKLENILESRNESS
jgi:hypothetical protein